MRPIVMHFNPVIHVAIQPDYPSALMRYSDYELEGHQQLSRRESYPNLVCADGSEEAGHACVYTHLNVINIEHKLLGR